MLSHTCGLILEYKYLYHRHRNTLWVAFRATVLKTLFYQYYSKIRRTLSSNWSITSSSTVLLHACPHKTTQFERRTEALRDRVNAQTSRQKNDLPHFLGTSYQITSSLQCCSNITLWFFNSFPWHIMKQPDGITDDLEHDIVLLRNLFDRLVATHVFCDLNSWGVNLNNVQTHKHRFYYRCLIYLKFRLWKRSSRIWCDVTPWHRTFVRNGSQTAGWCLSPTGRGFE